MAFLLVCKRYGMSVQNHAFCEVKPYLWQGETIPLGERSVEGCLREWIVWADECVVGGVWRLCLGCLSAVLWGVFLLKRGRENGGFLYQVLCFGGGFSKQLG